MGGKKKAGSFKVHKGERETNISYRLLLRIVDIIQSLECTNRQIDEDVVNSIILGTIYSNNELYLELSILSILVRKYVFYSFLHERSAPVKPRASLLAFLENWG